MAARNRARDGGGGLGGSNSGAKAVLRRHVMTVTSRAGRPVTRRAELPDREHGGRQADAARRGCGARGPSRALHAEHERAAALVPVRGRGRWLRTSGALASVARDGAVDARHAAQRALLRAGTRWLLVWPFLARGAGRPEDVAPVTRRAGWW